MSRVSVVIANYGPLDVLAPCLESLRADCLAGRAEVIVVDNATPGFPVAEFRRTWPWVKLLDRERNRGFANACNEGIRRSTADYVLLLNPDARVEPDTLSRMLDFMESSPATGAATCRVLLPDGTLDPACHRGFPTPWASACYYLGLERRLPGSKTFGRYHMTWLPRNEVHEIESPSGCFFLVRRQAIDRVGLLDEEFFMYGEDLDWAKRLRDAGWKIMFQPDVTVQHLKGMASGIKADSSTTSPASRADRERALRAFYDAMRIFYRKHYRRRHPFFVNWLVAAAVNFLERRARRRRLV